MTFKEAYEKDLIDFACVHFDAYTICCLKKSTPEDICNCTFKDGCPDYKRVDWEEFVSRCQSLTGEDENSNIEESKE